MPGNENAPAVAEPHCTMSPIRALGGEHRVYRGLAQAFAAHSHEHYVIGRIEAGERLLELNGIPVRIGSGDFIAFNPGDVHGCTQAGDELFAYDSVTISSELLDGAELGFIVEDGIDASAAYDELLRFIDADDDEGVVEQALYLASLFEKRCETAKPPVVHEDTVMRVFAHLRGHLAEPVSIKRLTEAEGISEYALIRAYKKRFSITPVQHLMSLRIECACGLLASGVKPAVVAAETGFSDQAHLTRMFKQRMGTTPASYAKMVARSVESS